METENTKPKSDGHIEGKILIGPGEGSLQGEIKGENDNIMAARSRISFHCHNRNAIAGNDYNAFNGDDSNVIAGFNLNTLKGNSFNVMAAKDKNGIKGKSFNAIAVLNDNAIIAETANIIVCKFNNAIGLTGDANIVVAANGSKFKGKKGNAICMVEFDDDRCEIMGGKFAIIDGKILKENTFYTFENGEFIEIT